MEHTFLAHIAQDPRRLVFNAPQYLKHFLLKVGPDVSVTITDKKPVRSMQQHRYLFGVVYTTIAEHTGHTVEELHQIFKRQFLPPRYVEWKGAMVKMVGSTKLLSKIDFIDYVEKIRAEGASMGVNVPDARDVDMGELLDNN